MPVSATNCFLSRPAQAFRRLAFSSASALVLASTGCGSLMTTAAINKFQDHLESGDITGIAASTTERFREAAIPDPAALTTFDLLGVPVGEVTIDEVKETSATTRDVLVSVDGSSRKLTYHLSKEPDALGRSRWLVDEITIRQGSSSKAVEKTVSEQMSLLLGVRDVVRAWQAADPQTIADHASDTLGERMRKVPSEWRTQLAKNYFAGVRNSKPRAKLIDGEAEVQLSHKDGQLRLILEQADASDREMAPIGGRGWVVKTAVIVGRGKEITRELRRETDLLVATSEFVRGYETSDKEKLKQASSKLLFENVLSVADLTQQSIPSTSVFASPYEARFNDVSNEISVTIDGAMIQFALAAMDEGRSNDQRVDEVAFFRDGEVMHLSAQLLVLPTVAMFNEALNSGDVARMRYLTGNDWERTVWKRFDEDRGNILATLALPEFRIDSFNPEQLPVIRHDGNHVEVRQIEQDVLVSYKLNSTSRRLVIDDVEIIDLNGVTRLRSRLTALCTLDQMADGVLMGDLSAVESASSAALNRIAWSLTPPEELPSNLDLIPILKGRVHSLESSDTETVVTISDGQPIARVLLNLDGTEIDDIVFLDRRGSESGRFGHMVRQHRIRTSKK